MRVDRVTVTAQAGRSRGWPLSSLSVEFAVVVADGGKWPSLCRWQTSDPGSCAVQLMTPSPAMLRSSGIVAALVTLMLLLGPKLERHGDGSGPEALRTAPF